MKFALHLDGNQPTLKPHMVLLSLTLQVEISALRVETESAIVAIQATTESHSPAIKNLKCGARETLDIVMSPQTDMKKLWEKKQTKKTNSKMIT